MPRLLIVTSNSKDEPLRLQEEVRNIQEVVGSGSNFLIRHSPETRAKDLIDILVTDPPDILHFAGHGLKFGDVGISLTGDDQATAVLTAKDFAKILSNIARRPQVVFLNACYSANLSDAILPFIDAVIGADSEIQDQAAIRFSTRFYSALANSCTLGAAFSLAQIELKVSGYDESQIKLHMNSPATATRLIFYARPELMAKFCDKEDGGLDVTNGHYNIVLYVRGADQNVGSVSYEICDKSYRRKDRYWEVARSESPIFMVDDFSSTGEITIRIVAWARTNGTGVESTLSEALHRHYSNEPPRDDISEAINIIRSK